MPMVKNQNDLPKFFKQKDGRISVKDTTVIAKNKLYQQEIKNTDPVQFQNTMTKFANTHRRMYLLDKEKSYYQKLLTQLTK
jgi:hypothetical protein